MIDILTGLFLFSILVFIWIAMILLVDYILLNELITDYIQCKIEDWIEKNER